MEIFLADRIKNDAYQLYKKDWCEIRGNDGSYRCR